MKKRIFPPKVLELLEADRNWRHEQLQWDMDLLNKLLEKCKSQAEQMIMLKLAEEFLAEPVVGDPPEYGICLNGAFSSKSMGLEMFKIIIHYQRIIRDLKEAYHADFLITLEEWNYEILCREVHAKLIIEIDDHETAEIVESAKKLQQSRDKYLYDVGYAVLRFTGNEVTSKPEEITDEAHRILAEKAHHIILYRERSATAKANAKSKSNPKGVRFRKK